MEGTDGLTIAAGASTIGIIGGLVGKFLQARYGRTEVANQPLMVQRQPDLVDKPDCEVRMSKIEKRIDRLEENTDKKLEDIYNKVNACAIGVGKIEGFMEAQSKKGSR